MLANRREVKVLTRQNNNHLVEISIYLSKNKRFKSFVYDRREIRNIANNLGCKTDHVRTELRKLVHHNINFKKDIQGEPNRRSNLVIQNLCYGALGYSLIKNSHGQMVWKKDQLKHPLTVAGI